MEFESLIFDIDGTLWDSRAIVAEGYNIQLEKEGLGHIHVTAEVLKPLFGKVMTEIGDALFASLPAEQRQPLMERCMETENRYIRSHPCNVGYPKVKETLAELSKRHRLFIVSNSQSGYPELCIRKLGIEDYVSGHLCYGDTGTSKDKTIRKLMERHGIESAVYIGDTLGDQQAADGAGIPFVFCAYGFGEVEHCTASVDSFEELLNIF